MLPTAVLGGVGLIAGVGLTIASRIFRVDEDPRIKKVRDILPGANCGGCGHAGCDAYAAAVVSGADEVNKCVVGQSETADAIANFLGYDRVASEPKTACSLCDGGYRADQKYEYSCHYLSKRPRPGWGTEYLDYDYRINSTGAAARSGSSNIQLVASRLYREGY